MEEEDSEPERKVLFTSRQIEGTVRKLAEKLKQDYQGRCPLFVSVLKGSFMFLADLVRFVELPVELDFIRVSSYGQSTLSGGKVRVVHGLSLPVAGREVVVIEDIVDTGYTTAFVIDYLRKRKPASLKLCVLTSKPTRRILPVNIDYLGFTAPDKFLVGYGLDYAEKFRNLPDICTIEE